MEVVKDINTNDCTSIFFNGPSHLISALLSMQDGFFSFPALGTRVDDDENAGQTKLTRMMEVARQREGLQRDTFDLEKVFIEMHYRFLEKKNHHLVSIERALIGMTDESIEKYLHDILLDRVNEVV